MKKKPDIRMFKCVFVEISKDPTSSTWDGEYREQLDFVQPHNGKRRRVFRIRASVSELRYMKERIDRAIEDIQARLMTDIND